MMDYDDYAYSHFKLNDNNNQLHSLLYGERRQFNYRLSDKGSLSYRKFTNYEMNTKRKQFKKNNSYGQIYGNKEFVSKFPIPDFALSYEDLVFRWKNSIYEKSKAYEVNIFEKVYKPGGRQTSITNLTSNESKFYKADKKKVNFDQVQPYAETFVNESRKNNSSRTSFLDVNNEFSSKFSGNINDVVSTSYHEKGKLLVMEPFLLIQNLQEERMKNKIIASKKAQKLMIHIIIGYTISFIVLSLISFYVMYFSS